MNIDVLPRHNFAQLPTPVQALRRLTQELNGPELLVKRDDQTGLALGGNKTRKLEFLIGDALEKGADTIITVGAAQSNHCRQTAAAAALAGLRCELVLAGDQPEIPNGNVLLNLFCGANLHWSSREHIKTKMEQVAEDLRRAGRKSYLIPLGGSNGLGAVAYAQAMLELNEQIHRMKKKVDAIVFASSSGGTQAGLVLGAGLARFDGKLIGISVDQKPFQALPYPLQLAGIANEAAAIIKAPVEFKEDDFIVNYDYLGKGYGIVGTLERNAIHLAARTEGLIVDPVYTGRAMGGLIDLIQNGFFSPKETVLFLHTGGAPALFAYAEELIEPVLS